MSSSKVFCQLCNKECKGTSGLNIHKARMHKDHVLQPIVPKCTQTGNIIPAVDSMPLPSSLSSLHYISSNEGSQMCVCTICGKQCKTKRGLDVHQSKLHADCSFVDQDVDIGSLSESVSTSSPIANDNEVHTNLKNKSLLCQVCRKKCRTRTGLQAHERNAHGTVLACDVQSSDSEIGEHVSDSLSVSNSVPVSNDQPLQDCEVVDTHLTREDSSSVNLSTDDEIDNSVQSRIVRNVEGRKVSDSETTDCSGMLNRRKKGTLFICPVCKRNCKSRLGLHSHLSCAHTNFKPSNDFVDSDSSMLSSDEHVSECNVTQQTSFVCSQCKRQYDNKLAFDMHLLNSAHQNNPSDADVEFNISSSDKGHVTNVERLSTVSSDSDASKNETRRSSRLQQKRDKQLEASSDDDNTVMFKKPRLPSSKHECSYCHKMFANLANHRKCAKRVESDVEPECDLSSDAITNSEASSDESCSSYSPLKGPKQKLSSRQSKKHNMPFSDLSDDVSNVNSALDSVGCSDSSISTKTDHIPKNPVNDESSQDEACSGKNEHSGNLSDNDNVNHPSEVAKAPQCGQTRKTRVGIELNRKLSELNRKYRPPIDTSSEVDPLHQKLKNYHDQLSLIIDNVTCEKLSPEAISVIEDVTKIDDINRIYRWSNDDQERLNQISAQSKQLKPHSRWCWGAKDDSKRGVYNDKRMEFCIDEEMKTEVIHCPQCKCTGLLIGNQIGSSVCVDCLALNKCQSEKHKLKVNDAWDSVRPPPDYPKRTERGHESEDLPHLTNGEMSCLALHCPVVTVTRSNNGVKKYRQESITVTKDVKNTFCSVLPRTDLKDRFLVIERTAKDKKGKKYVAANAEKVKHWLLYLFDNHKEFIRLKKDNELELSYDALEALRGEQELAEVCDEGQGDSETNTDDVEPQHNVTTNTDGVSSSHVFSFDKYYLKSHEFLKIKESGKMELVEDRSARVPIYAVSPSVCFPHLYCNGEMSPLDFGDYKLAKLLLKRQTMFAHRMADSRYKWNYAADSVHMMYCHARTIELNVKATVGWYISTHAESSHLPIESILTAFRDGCDDDGLLDSRLPDLSTLMMQMPGSNQKWFAERCGMESIGRDRGDGHIFLTLSTEPRAWPDVRELIHKLEFGTDMPRDAPFEQDNDKFSELMSKYAPHLAIYLYRKVKIFLNCFFFDICGISRTGSQDWTKSDRTDDSWWWGRVEFHKTGKIHYHCIAKLPSVLDTSILARMVQNGRVVREEIKCGNIKASMQEESWRIVEAGLLANKYLTLFANSISTTSLYSEDVDSHDPSKVLDIDKYREEFAENYRQGNINRTTHPLMRKFNDPECDDPFVELAKVAAVCCVHNCIASYCGFDGKTGKGCCRYDMPKRNLNHTVVAMMSISTTQVEARVLLRRTHGRLSHMNKYLLRYYRSNMDLSVLVDASCRMRYATKYAAKSEKATELLNEVIDALSKRSMDLMPLNTKQVLSNLILADCSHRAFVTKQELSYHVLGLPTVLRSFPAVSVVGCYRRAYITEKAGDETIVYSDRTQYSAYAERCSERTVIRNRKNVAVDNVLTAEEIAEMNLREFAETINHRWVKDKDQTAEAIEGTSRRVLSRDVNSGHWEMQRCQRRRNSRWSTVLYSEPAIQYEPVELGDTTTQTTFFGLSAEKRKQLFRAYQELISYVAWTDSPDTLISDEADRAALSDLSDPEKDSRYSLMRLEIFFKEYQRRWTRGEVAVPGSLWQRDAQYSYSMYLTSLHNRSVHLSRVDNRGVLKAQFEGAEELDGTEVDIRPAIVDELDDAEFPSVLNFLPPDTFREIMEQEPPEISEISVAYPLQHNWQQLQEIATIDRSKLFMANPPACNVKYEDMTDIQKWAVDLGTDESQKILYLCGHAGSGKTTVALKICEKFHNRVQCCCSTALCSSLYNAPTIHCAMGFSYNSFSAAEEACSKTKIQQLRTFYDKTDVFVIDEINAISAEMLGLLHETMTAVFNPEKTKNSAGDELPFANKKCIFAGDIQQLQCIKGIPIYQENASSLKPSNLRACRGNRQRQFHRSAKGQELYRKYLLPNCVLLLRSQRNCGLLRDICDRIRDGKQTDDDLYKLTYLRKHFPEADSDFGIHYSNEYCSLFNWRQLWASCQEQTPSKRLYICKASYHMTNDNQPVVDGLAAMPPSKFNFAPDVLCVAEGSEVRLVKNINVSAGLVNSTSGTVVRIIYNAADAKAVAEGKHPGPYCIIIELPAFRGFVLKNKSDERLFPFPKNPQWVPVYRQKFLPVSGSLPSWIVKKQTVSQCYREQFPLDLSKHMTVHRAQGQTLGDCVLSVDLGLDNPDNKAPADMGAIIYVACTRVRQLKNLLVSPIYPSLWKSIGQSPADIERRKVELKMETAAKSFASDHNMLQKVTDELSWKPDYSNVDVEWNEIHNLPSAPTCKPRIDHVTEDDELVASISPPSDDTRAPESSFRMCLKAVRSERHIGIDQGMHNFAIAVVDTSLDKPPVFIAADNFDLCLRDRFTAQDLRLALHKKTPLWNYMQQTADHLLPTVDRVLVHLEQMSQKNAHSKQFCIGLGKELQKAVNDPNNVIVKLSTPHIHRPNGPMFHIGQRIVTELNLRASQTYQRKRRSNPATSNIAATQRKKARRMAQDDTDVENGDDGVDQLVSDDHSTPQVPRNEQSIDSTLSDDNEYQRKKLMSESIFRYFVEADDDQQQDLGINVDANLQQTWRGKIAEQPSVRLHDVGDALLHSLNEILCGGSNYKQLVPASCSLHSNRTVVINVTPSMTYWIVIHCLWNVFELEDFGLFESHMEDKFYHSQEVVNQIKNNLDASLKTALTDMTGSDLYHEIDHIKVIIKQITGYGEFTNKQAGSLNHATVTAMKQLCDEAVGSNSQLCDRYDKILGTLYIQTNIATKQKYQVIRSNGKHTNAILSCLEWFREHAKRFVETRSNVMAQDEKLLFFLSLEEIACSEDVNRLEMLQLSQSVKNKFNTESVVLSDQSRIMLADLILIALNKNQQHVKSIASSFRKSHIVPAAQSKRSK